MQELHVDLTTLAALWIGCAVLLVPLAGLTARFGFKPLLEAVSRMRAADRRARAEAELDVRFAALEQHLRDLTRAVDRLAAESQRGHAVAS